MNSFERTGLLSGFDPQTKWVTLSYVLRTLLAAYCRINNRVVGEAYHLYGAVKASVGEQVVCRFMLPKLATNVIVWHIGYKTVPVPPANGNSDQLAMDIKPTKLSAEQPSAKAVVHLVRETQQIYALFAEHPSKRAEGPFYFYVVSYELDGCTHNSYLAFFAENLDSEDRRGQLKLLAEYVGYLASGSPTYGDYFIVYAPVDGVLAEKGRIPNVPLTTPVVSLIANENDIIEDGIDFTVVPMVIKNVSRGRRGGEQTTAYEIAHMGELNTLGGCLLSYIRGVHASGHLRLPGLFNNDSAWPMVIRSAQKTMKSVCCQRQATADNHIRACRKHQTSPQPHCSRPLQH